MEFTFETMVTGASDVNILPSWKIDVHAQEVLTVIPRKNGKYGRVNRKDILNHIYNIDCDFFVVELDWKRMGYSSLNYCYNVFYKAIDYYGYNGIIRLVKRGNRIFLVKDVNEFLTLEKR